MYWKIQSVSSNVQWNFPVRTYVSYLVPLLFQNRQIFLLYSQHPCWRSDGAESFSFLILLRCYQLGSLKKKRREKEKGKGKEQGKEKRIVCANHILQWCSWKYLRCTGFSHVHLMQTFFMWFLLVHPGDFSFWAPLRVGWLCMRLRDFLWASRKKKYCYQGQQLWLYLCSCTPWQYKWVLQIPRRKAGPVCHVLASSWFGLPPGMTLET